jgi:uncharacterized membrane protein YkvA (DUF1232 family)
MDVWGTLIGVLAGLLAVYAAMLLSLWAYARRHPDTVAMTDALRLLPDLLRTIRRMAADPQLPLGVRVKLGLLLAYLLFPLDLVPDFLPVIGYADDVVVLALALRSVVRSAGPSALRRHWPGTPSGLAVVERLAGIRATDP